MKTKIILILMLLLTGCSGGYYKSFDYFNNKCFKINCKGPNIELYDSIALDDSYKYYKRQICEEQTAVGLLRNNCEDMNNNKRKKEIEYLFISETSRKVIYITTIPSYNSQLIYHNPLYSNDNLFNIWDLNIFHFGQIIDKNKIEFIDKDKINKYYWEYQIDQDGSFRITSVTNNDGCRMNIMPALSPVVKFASKQNLVFSLNGNRYDGCGYNTLLTDHQYILFGKSGRTCKKTKYYVFFRFKDILNDTTGSVSAKNLVLFNDKRIRSLPLRR